MYPKQHGKVGQLQFIDGLPFLQALIVKSNDPNSLLIIPKHEPDLNKVELLKKREFIRTST